MDAPDATTIGQCAGDHAAQADTRINLTQQHQSAIGTQIASIEISL